MYCLSGMRFSLHFKAKEHFIHKYYGDDIKENIVRFNNFGIKALLPNEVETVIE